MDLRFGPVGGSPGSPRSTWSHTLETGHDFQQLTAHLPQIQISNPKADISVGPAWVTCPPWTNHPWDWSWRRRKSRTFHGEMLCLLGLLCGGQLPNKMGSTENIHWNKYWIKVIRLLPYLGLPEIIGTFILSPASKRLEEKSRFSSIQGNNVNNTSGKYSVSLCKNTQSPSFWSLLTTLPAPTLPWIMH